MSAEPLTKNDHAHPRGSGAGARIEAEGIWKRYGDVAACRDVNLTIEASEFVTLLGPSGSGKTTLLNIIAGFTKPTEGSLQVDGHDLTRTPSHKRDIGMVFQQYALFPHMTVAENVMFPLKQRKMPAAEAKQKVQLALQTVHLGDLGHRRPGQLSGGQQQRVALARAIVYGPRVLLMDEPLGALDKKLREWLQLEIKRVHREVGSTFVFVTHDQEEALVLSDRIAVFNNGGIEQVGTADELWPASSVTPRPCAAPPAPAPTAAPISTSGAAWCEPPGDSTRRPVRWWSARSGCGFSTPARFRPG
jgi:putative spermidine/putrescine transport system ATP-binding protein